MSSIAPKLRVLASEATTATGASVHATAEGRAKNDSLKDPGISKTDFWAYMPEHRYICIPTRDLWPASSVNSRLPAEEGEDGKPVKAAMWLDKNRPVDQMTWAPGLPSLIENRLIDAGGWIDRIGVRCFNLYRPPNISPGDPSQVQRWITQIQRVYPDCTDHIIRWLAHRVQCPGEKVNHALVLGGPQGIGKDTILEPIKYGVGPWNFQEVSPAQLLGRFNSFVKSVVLRVNEARDLGDVDRFAFYDHLKAYTASPPDVLRCDEKNVREYSVLNVCGLIITSNHKSDGVYLPADDRRHYVAWSQLTKDVFTEKHWQDLWGWYRNGGIEHVVAYLKEYDLSTFDPKAPPPKTAAWWDIVDANRAPEDAELADVLDKMQNPDAVTLTELSDRSDEAFSSWLRDRKNSRNIPHRMEAAGYERERNPDANDGLWKVGRKRQVVYVKRELSTRNRLVAVQLLIDKSR